MLVDDQASGRGGQLLAWADGHEAELDKALRDLRRRFGQRPMDVLATNTGDAARRRCARAAGLALRA